MLNSTFRQLEVFVAVVNAGSFARAAEELGVSQPGISRHIKALEDQCGGSLIHRAPGRRSQLTALGEILYAGAPALVHGARMLRQDLLTARDRQRVQSVRVTGHPYVMEHIIRPMLPDFMSSYPRAAIQTSAMTPEVMQRRSAILSADLAFVMVWQTDEPDVEILRPLECGLVVGAKHPLTDVSEVGPKELGTASFILPLPDSSFERAVLSVLRDLGCVDIKVAARAQFVEVMRGLVLRNKGIAYLPTELVAAELNSGAVVRLPVAAPPMYLGVIVAGGAPVNNAANALINFVREPFSPSSARS